MTVNKIQDGTKLTLELEGRLDTTTAPMLDENLGDLAGVNDLIFDFANLEYISSAGLRVLLSTQKIMNKQGSMAITHANDTIREIFDITGFSNVLTVIE